MLLCHGLLNSNSSPLFDKKTASWKLMTVSLYHLTANKFKSKIEHRWNAFTSARQSAVLPHPKQWSLPKVLMWLSNNPITDYGVIAFLVKTINKWKQAAKNAMIDKASEKGQLERNWLGRYPYLSLIHALVNNDDIKHAFLSWHDIPSVCLAIENHK